VEEIIKAQSPDTRFDRAHFKAYGDSALQFEVVYYMLTADYGKYMDVQQKINLALLRQFREAGITFAYPTRTLYIASTEEQNPLKSPSQGDVRRAEAAPG
jgi:small-conductance mechanosensitive channel